MKVDIKLAATFIYKKKGSMTRLNSKDIAGIIPGLAQFDAMLKNKTGENLLGIACHGLRCNKKEISQLISDLTIAVVPFTCGAGIIDGFSQTIKEITAYLGFSSFVTHAADASGIAEAYERSSDIIMMADDHRYCAIHLKQMKIVDNAWATGNAFASALDLMAGGLKGKNTLITWCGPVGQAAIKTLINFGAKAAVYDQDLEKCRIFSLTLAKHYKKELIIEHSLKDISGRYKYIVEASSAKDIIDIDHISQKTYITAPGIPLGISDKAVKKLENRILHDTLQLGTVTMAVEAARSD